MKKIRLSLETLSVASFSTEAKPVEKGGTVRAYATGAYDDSCTATCNGSCDETCCYSCDFVCVWNPM